MRVFSLLVLLVCVTLCMGVSGSSERLARLQARQQGTLEAMQEPGTAAAGGSPFAPQCGFCKMPLTYTGPAPPVTPGLSDARQAILRSAQSYLGKVSDCPAVGTQKLGADLLVKIYTDALDVPTLEPSLEANTRKANNKASYGGYSWCGILCVAAIKNAQVGVQVAWVLGSGVSGLPKKYGNAGMKVGDIALYGGELNHHDIVEYIDIAAGKVYCIDGKQGCNGITRTLRDLKTVVGYYQVLPD